MISRAIHASIDVAAAVIIQQVSEPVDAALLGQLIVRDVECAQEVMNRVERDKGL